MQANTLQQQVPPPQYDAAFYLYSFKIVPCNNSGSHNWSLCPFVHAKEKARRRDPRLYNYQPLPCPEDRKGINCPRGDECPYTHNVYEYWLHPQRFRTQMCQQGQLCTRPLCFFAHTLEELRVVNQNGAKAAQPTSQGGTSSLMPPAAGSTFAPPALTAALGNGGISALGNSKQVFAPHAPSAMAVIQPSLHQQQNVQAGISQLVAPAYAQPQQALHAYQPALIVQRPPAPQPLMQDTPLYQQQLMQLSAQQQQPQGVPPVQVQHLQAVPGGSIGVFGTVVGPTVNSHTGHPQLHQELSAPVAAQQQPLATAQQPWQGQMLYAAAQNQQQQQLLPQPAAGHAQALSAAQDQGVINSSINGQQMVQVQISQQSQQPWLQQQQHVPLGGSVAGPQLLHVHPAGQVVVQGGTVGGAVVTQDLLQAAMQQLSLANTLNLQ